MKKNLSFLFLPVIALMAACSGGMQKKVVVMSSGKIQTDDNNPTIIRFDPGTQHNEKSIMFSGGKITLTVKSPAGDKTYDLADNGTYLLNLKSDTLTGSLMSYGSSGPPTSFSKEEFQQFVDSTQMMLTGKNASDAKRTYFLPPFTIKKISPATATKVIGPYNAIPESIEVDESGKTPEVFKFSTNAQNRKDLEDLMKRMSQ